MNSLRQLWSRLTGLGRRRQLEAEMTEEMRQHLERRTREKIADGLPPDEARLAAQREFGGVDQIKEQCRDERRFVWLEQAAQDVRYAARSLCKAPGFAVVAVLTVALGIATATTMFTFYSAELLRPMPFLAEEASLLRLQAYQINSPDDEFGISAADFRDLRTQMRSLASTVGVWNRTFVVGGDERPERAAGSAVSVEAFPMLGVQPILGRHFHPDEGKPGAAEVVLLSHGLWQRGFGGRADIVGRTITVNHRPAVVVGVMPAGFGFPINSALWQPLREDSGGRVDVYARMAPGAPLPRVQAELDAAATRFEQERAAVNTGLRFRALLLHDHAVRGDRSMLQLLLGAGLVVLLLACVNVANLLLARAATRTREIALRVSLGASRGRVMRQLLTESLLLGLLGGAVSLPLVLWQRDLLLAFAPFEAPYWLRFDFDWRVVTFALFVMTGTALFFGLFPALQCVKADQLHPLKDAGRSATASGAALRLRSALVVVQTALAFMLLIVGGLMTRSFFHLATVRLGFEPSGVLTFRTGLPDSVERTAPTTLGFYEAIEEKLRATPRVEGVAFLSFLPMRNSRNDAIVIEGRPELKAGELQSAIVRAASPDVLNVLRIPLLRGRFFEARDRADQPPVAVVDEAFVKKYFSNADPVGRRFAFATEDAKTPPRWFTIVGVIGQVTQNAAERAAEPNIWTAMAQAPDNFMDVAIRTSGDPVALIPTVHEAVRAVRADTPAFAVFPMTRVARDAIGWERLFGGVFASFAALAVFLASIGLYGVMAYHVTQRTREIGVRMALGAPARSIMTMIFRQGGIVVALGIGLGIVIAWLTAARMAGMLHGISAHDPVTFMAVPLVMTAVAFAACAVPARRATRVDPMTVLSAE